MGPIRPALPRPLVLSATLFFGYKQSAPHEDSSEAFRVQFVARLGEFERLDVIDIVTHTDRIASRRYNRKLSEQRALAIKSMLLSAGVDASILRIRAQGKLRPVVSCKETDRTALIACLAPNRRAEVRARGLAL